MSIYSIITLFLLFLLYVKLSHRAIRNERLLKILEIKVSDQDDIIARLSAELEILAPTGQEGLTCWICGKTGLDVELSETAWTGVKKPKCKDCIPW